MLVELKANIHLTYGFYDWSPLHQACWLGHEDIVPQLLHAGADAYATDKKGWTALHLAAYGGRANITELLLRDWLKDITIPHIVEVNVP